MKPPVKILGISGSLRAGSSNNIIVQAMAALVPSGVAYTVYNGLHEVPPFNDSTEAPPAVAQLRQQLQETDGIFICQPEYAFGVSGVLKNALDWTVASGELVGKPLALVTAATGGDKAHAAMLLTFKALSAAIPPGGELVISYVRTKLGPDGAISHKPTEEQLRAVADALAKAAGEEKI